ncbi:MAG: RNA-binding S4 domain-containing protein [Clostridiaceae bacterium]|nr:RNA-binding S4 domain-containing protein [Clostridiaceae bacterium]
MKNISISTEYIKLDQFIKWADVVPTGSDAKVLISNGLVKVNGVVEVRRGRKLRKADIIEVEGVKFIIE